MRSRGFLIEMGLVRAIDSVADGLVEAGAKTHCGNGTPKLNPGGKWCLSAKRLESIMAIRWRRSGRSVISAVGEADAGGDDDTKS